MGKLFIVYYTVTLQHADKKDVAIVKAKDEAGAIKNLKGYLMTCSSAINDINISLIKEYNGLIFTRNFGQDD